jgi:hypothetical protein
VPTKLKTVLDFVYRYALWLVSCAGGFYLLLRARNTVLFGMTGVFGAGAIQRYKVALVDRWSIIIIAIALIVFIGMIEYYYSRAKNARLVLTRFLIVTGIELLVLAGIDAIMQIILGINTRNVLSVLLFAAELVAGVLLVTHRTWWAAIFRRGEVDTNMPKDSAHG